MTRYDKYNAFSTTTKEHKLSTLVKDGLLNQLKQMVAWLAEYHRCFAFDINLTGTYPRLKVAGTHLSDSHGTYSTSLYVHSRSDLRQCFKPWLENWQSNHIEWQHWMTQATQFKAREKHGSSRRNASKWTWKERIKSLFLHSEIFKDSRSRLGCKVTMRQLSASVDVVDLLWGAVQWAAKTVSDLCHESHESHEAESCVMCQLMQLTSRSSQHSAGAREYTENTRALECTTHTEKWKTYADDVDLFLTFDAPSAGSRHIFFIFCPWENMFWHVLTSLTMFMFIFDLCYCSFLISLVRCQVGQFKDIHSPDLGAGTKWHQWTQEEKERIWRIRLV